MSSTSTSSSSDTSSSPEEDAAAAGMPAAAATPATVTPAAKKKRKAKPSISHGLIMELLKAALCMVLPNEKVVEAMIPAMLEDSKVQELVEKLEAQGAGGKRAKGTAPEVKGRLRSAYTMFVTQMFAVLKAAGIHNISLQDVSGLWQALPEQQREDIVARFNAIKGPYNAAVDAGEAPDLGEALAAYAEEEGLGAIPLMDIYAKYKDSAKLAAAAAAAGGAADAGAAKAKPAKKAAAAAATPAAAAAAAAPGTGEKSAKKHKKDKEKKKDKKHKAEAEAAPTTEKKKKKHKHDKVKQEDSD